MSRKIQHPGPYTPLHFGKAWTHTHLSPVHIETLHVEYQAADDSPNEDIILKVQYKDKDCRDKVAQMISNLRC